MHGVKKINEGCTKNEIKIACNSEVASTGNPGDMRCLGALSVHRAGRYGALTLRSSSRAWCDGNKAGLSGNERFYSQNGAEIKVTCDDNCCKA